MADHRDKIVQFVRLRGPLLPTEIKKEVGTDTLFASAMLSELVDSKILKLSSLKVGGSPLYFAPGQEYRLQNFSDKLDSKDKLTYDLLKTKIVLKDIDQEPLTRVSLRQLRDFAVPLEVKTDSGVEIFWKWYLTPTNDVKERIGILAGMQAVPSSSSNIQKQLLTEQSIPATSPQQSPLHPHSSAASQPSSQGLQQPVSSPAQQPLPQFSQSAFRNFQHSSQTSSQNIQPSQHSSKNQSHESIHSSHTPSSQNNQSSPVQQKPITSFSGMVSGNRPVSSGQSQDSVVSSSSSITPLKPEVQITPEVSSSAQHKKDFDKELDDFKREVQAQVRKEMKEINERMESSKDLKFQKGKEAKKEKQEAQKPLAEDLPAEEPKDKLFKRVKHYFDTNRIVVKSYKIHRKEKDMDFVIEIPSSVGKLVYFCKAKDKQKFNDGDLSSVFIEAQRKKMPILYLVTGELTKKAQQMLETEFKNMSVKQL